MSFRKVFKLATKNPIRWFPGHMGRGLRQMQQKLKAVDCIIEVHDARIPLSGRNPDFQNTIGGIKPHILILNKMDLSDRKTHRKIKHTIKEREGIEHVIFTNCKNPQCNGIKRVMPLAAELIVNSNRYNRSEETDFCVMVAGVPNVGKSSLLNVMRNRHLNKRKAAAVGAVAGITRSVLTKIKISESPLIYMIDTPGILEPKISDDEMGMKLALCGCFPDHLVGEDIIADYLLFWLNLNEKFEYTELVGLPQPTDSIEEVLVTYANKLGKTKKLKTFDGSSTIMPDVILSANHFIKAFRTGHFGPVNLDLKFLQ